MIKINGESGFTLVELLITMAIFGIILGGILKVYDTNNYTYKVQEEVVAMNQNVRVSKMFLERDIRMAGCGLTEFAYENAIVSSIEFDNDTTSGDPGTDKLTVRYIDYNENSCSGLLPQLISEGSMPPTSRECNIQEDLDVSPYDAWNQPFVCGGITYGDVGPGGFVDFPIIVISPDGTRSDVLVITNVQAAGADNLQNAHQGTYNNQVLSTYPEGSTINFFDKRSLKEYTYYVSSGVLMRDRFDFVSGVAVSDPIAEDIDDLQFAFKLDTDGDGVVDSPWINNTDLTHAQRPQVRLVRINVLGRTATEHRGHTDVRPEIEDNSAAAISDGFRRKHIQVTVKVRNLGLN